MNVYEYLNKLNMIDAAENLSEYIDTWRDLEERIDRLPERRHRILLSQRYILFRRWNCIAEYLDVMPARIYSLHKDAAAAFKKMNSDIL